jgi:hypothetical protein
MIKAITTISLIVLVMTGTVCSQASVSIQTYVTAHQVMELFQNPDQQQKTLSAYNELGIEKVYLETVRSGFMPDEKVLMNAKSLLEENGIAVTAGIATIRGEDFCEPTNYRGIWVNYAAEKTQKDLANRMRFMAERFDEIIVDDFLATDDTSEISVKQKGDKSWSEYRLSLMTDFSRQYIIAPARKVNPDIHLILKFPQWYDRFHRFGYNVETAPTLYDRIWVGTETRNPDTVRYGFVQPTQGYINYSWLASNAKEKIGGAWFDFGDCTPTSYLMQAYQSVLAGARELVLFESGSVVNQNECLKPFKHRLHAIPQLGKICDGKTKKGLIAYKPPHSEGSDKTGAANLYIYDYLATLGLSPIPVSSTPDTFDSIFLSRQSADDPSIESHLMNWLKQEKVILMTPDFVTTLNDKVMVKLLRLSSLRLDGGTIETNEVKVNDQVVNLKDSISIRSLSLHTDWKIIAEGKSSVLAAKLVLPNKGSVILLNLPTFTHEEFGPGKEQFLPPRPLSVTQWPQEIGDAIRKEIPNPHDCIIESPNNVGIYYMGSSEIIVTNFNDQDEICSLSFDSDKSVKLHSEFDHKNGTNLRLESNGEYKITVPAWETVILTISN